MEFLPKRTNAVPKNLYPCLATITVTPPGAPLSRRTSYTVPSDPVDDNVLTRVISGRRRKSSFGTETATAPNTTTNGDPNNKGNVDSGKWYWRVQAGVTDTHLVLLPLSTPFNPLLKSPPAPLSEAMPFHSVNHDRSVGDEAVETGSEHTGFIDKIKHTLHIGSPKKTERRLSQGETTAQPPATTEDKIIDQTTSGAPVAGGDTSIETNWPGVVGGEKLASIVIPIQSIEKGKVTLGGGKKGEASWVNVSVLSHFQTLAHSMLESVGAKHHESWGKSGSIKFEFDKEWIGAKAEAELLHHYITSALENPVPQFDAPTEDNIHAPGDQPTRNNKAFFPDTLQLGRTESNEAYESLRRPTGEVTPSHLRSVQGGEGDGVENGGKVAGA